MFHSVLAKEHTTVSSEPDSSCHSDGDNQEKRRHIFKVLNYAPGPCKTDMSDYLADPNTNLDEGIQQYYAKSKKENTLIQPGDTAKKLIQILSLDEFESGSHVDYLDSEELQGT